MHRGLLIEANDKLNELLALNLLLYADVRLDILESVGDAMNLFNQDSSPSFDLIIISEIIEGQKAAETIYNFLRAKGFIIPMIVLSDSNPIPGDDNVLTSPHNDLKGILRSVSQLIGISAKEMATKIVPDYYPIPIQYFNHIDLVDYDLFIPKMTGSGKKTFIPHFPAKQGIAKSDLSYLLNKGELNLYVQAKERLRLANSLSSKLLEELQATSKTLDEKLGLGELSMELVSETVVNALMTPATLELAKACVNSVKATVKGHKQLDVLLENLISNRVGYNYTHCTLISFITHHMLKLYEWADDSDEEKLGFVAFFHDILLNDKMAEITNDDQLKQSGFSQKDQEHILTHAIKTADILGHMQIAPTGAAHIIKQHHGKTDGKGFGRFFPGDLSRLTAVFIIAEDMAHTLLRSKTGQFQMETFISKMTKKFMYPKHKKLLSNLTDLPL